MAKRTYADWLKAEQTNINPAGTPVIARPSATVGANYAALMLRNEQIRNTPETARGGYSALAPVETVSASVPKLATANPYDEDFNAGAAYGVYGVQKTENGATAPATTPATGTSFSFANLDDASKARMKQNNPALYNQLLVQGIITPLAEDQKQTATAPVSPYNYGAPKIETATKPASGQSDEKKTESGTGSTEPTFADYLALHPEYDEAKRQAEADYYRNRANYGANAETLAQMGIHGGYGDYLDAQAYAEMQNKKSEIAREASEKFAEKQAATDETVRQIYDALVGGEYANMLAYQNDEEYNAAKETTRADLLGRGYTPAQIDEAFGYVENTRGTIMKQAGANVEKAIGEMTADGGKIDSDALLKAFGYGEVQRGYDLAGNEIPDETQEAFEKRKGEYYLQSLDTAYANGWITEEQRSTGLKDGLPMYSTSFAGYKDGDIKSKGGDLSDSVLTAVTAYQSGKMTESDFMQVLKDAQGILKSGKVTIEYQTSVGWDNIRIDIGNHEIIHADNYGNVSEEKEKELNARMGDKKDANGNYENRAGVLAIDFSGEVDENGNYKYNLYYREGENRRWQKLKTKEGSVSDSNGGVGTGDNWLAVFAVIQQYLDKKTFDFYERKTDKAQKEAQQKAKQREGTGSGVYKDYAPSSSTEPVNRHKF